MANIYFLSVLIIFFHVLPSLHALIFFSYTNFSDPSNMKLNTSGDAVIVRGKVALTQCLADAGLNFSVGDHAMYPKEMHLWDRLTGKAADFVTIFSFNITSLNRQDGGDSFAFFVAPNSGCMGVVSNCSNFNTTKIIAVVFDTKNPNIGEVHVGININSIVSAASQLKWDPRMKNGSMGKAWNITYDSQRSNLSVFLSFLNLTETHCILSCVFNSTELLRSSANNRGGGRGGRAHTQPKVLMACVVGGFCVVVGVISILVFFMRKIRIHQKEKTEDSEEDNSIDHEFENGSGPRRFSYVELVQATDNFAKEGKLGEGGFGAVYRGFLPMLNLGIAVKRSSKTSNQGRKEYISEVKIISKLRHKNLVQLMGWYHKKGEFLIVYELMPHGSLDSHLFGTQNRLSWGLRYKVALGLASAILYLHEESEQCVVHRDIKSSNVMLDSNFNAKLGDFGLARCMNQESEHEMTGLAGTLGYIAPEYISKGQVSKKSDVFSFGVVALEIASGRRSLEPQNREADVSLVDKVWTLYENGRLLEVADEKLCMEFDMDQMECLLIVGLWCAHPDHNLRPSIRQALQVLHFEAPFPNLGRKVSVASPTSDITIYPSSSFNPMISNSVIFMGR
ncbi:hypothetical protein PTKIN_Ptkin12aG0031300 [Pterospermum kingtungense]